MFHLLATLLPEVSQVLPARFDAMQALGEARRVEVRPEKFEAPPD
jgi:hypothetical protein